MFENIKVFIPTQQRLCEKLVRYFDEANFAYDDNDIVDMEQVAIDKAYKIASKLVEAMQDTLDIKVVKYQIYPIYHKLKFTIDYIKEKQTITQTFEMIALANSVKLIELDD